MYLGIYIHIHIYVTIHEKRGHDFDSEQGIYMGRLGGRKTKGEMM